VVCYKTRIFFERSIEMEMSLEHGNDAGSEQLIDRILDFLEDDQK